jgi:CDP-4-dehydro-6-deoxyglucose reductase
MPSPSSFEARLVGARPVTPKVRELLFERVDGQPMSFEAGQWVNAWLPVGTGPDELKRAYSIASAPDESARFEIAVTHVQNGPGSTWLHALGEAAIVRFSGPHGFFTRPATGGPPSLFIATGTGVTPFRSMMRAALASGSTAPMWLLLGVRSGEDLLYGQDVRALAQAHPFVRFEPTLSRADDAWRGRRGYVQGHARELWQELVATTVERPHAYVCGLERMVGSVRELLRKDMGALREQVHTERYD